MPATARGKMSDLNMSKKDPPSSATAGNIYTCGLCGKRFTRKNLLTWHVHMAHSAKGISPLAATASSDKTKGEEKTVASSERSSFKCSSCEFTARTRSSIALHERVHKKPESFRCSRCDFSTSSAAALSAHAEEHGDDYKPFECPCCPMTFKRKKNLAEHEKRHSKDWAGEFRCADCCLGFKSVMGMNRHMVIQHGIVKPGSKKSGREKVQQRSPMKKKKERAPLEIFHGETKKIPQEKKLDKEGSSPPKKTERKCPHSDFATKRKGSPVQHETQHAGEKPLQCRHCSMSFGREDSRRNHEKKRYVGPDGPRGPFRCGDCCSGFASRGALNGHRTKSHASDAPDFNRCIVCGKKYLSKTSLNDHIRRMHLDNDDDDDDDESLAHLNDVHVSRGLWVAAKNISWMRPHLNLKE